jgi:hypothetical protein
MQKTEDLSVFWGSNITSKTLTIFKIEKYGTITRPLESESRKKKSLNLHFKWLNQKPKYQISTSKWIRHLRKHQSKLKREHPLFLTILLCPSVLRNIPARLAGSTFYYQAGNTMYCRTLLL